MAEYELWDPSEDAAQAQAGDEGLGRASSRHALFQIRDRLQRSVISGGQFNTFERLEDRALPYVPASHARHPVLHQDAADGVTAVAGGQGRTLGKDDDVFRFAPNAATALLLSRQFEALSRKDIQLEEKDELTGLLHAYAQTTRWLLLLEYQAQTRRLSAQAEEQRSRHEAAAAAATTHLIDLESACRRRMDQLAAECRSLLDKELSRAFDVLQFGQQGSQRHWLEQQESRSRHNLILDHDRILSRVYAMQIAECQGIVLRSIASDSRPDSGSPPRRDGMGSARAAQTEGSRGATPSSPERKVSDIRGSGREIGEKQRATPDAPLDDTMPVGYLESEDDEENLPMSFEECWGWMARSAGVLATWQRRFFVFTRSGRLKSSTASDGPWQLVLDAKQLLRVELDSYNDVGGCRPPADQYHQWGFYVDLAGQHSPRPERLRFCCDSKAELARWLRVLRGAIDVVLRLEETNCLPPTPGRIRTAQASSGGHRASYRRRIALEHEAAAMTDASMEAVELSRRRSSATPQKQKAPAASGSGTRLLTHAGEEK